MGYLVLPNRWRLLLCALCLSCICICYVEAVENVVGTVIINGKSAIARTDEDFICATLDWWPPEKCDYGTCSWGQASLLNLDLNNVVFLNAIKAFSPLKIRLGGTLQDKLIYQTEENKLQPCVPFAKDTSQMFGFTGGCLPLARWDELNAFFRRAGALVIFGLNALHGRAIHPENNSAIGPWDPTNAASLIGYTVKKGYKIYGWELGNELSGNGVGVGVSADTYASDTIVLHDLVRVIYKESYIKPLILSPGGFFDAGWFQRYLGKANGWFNVITHHIYSLGPGSDEHLLDKILNPYVLDSGADVFRNLHNLVRTSGTSATAWVGEAGGAYNSGRNGVTNTFAFSFWYLDQLGAASTYDTKTYCRQTLIGGNYGLLNTATFAPNPDYYSALLWHRLMGRDVLSTNFTGTRAIRAYAHCAKLSRGITLLLINMDHTSTVEVKAEIFGNPLMPQRQRQEKHRSKANPGRELYGAVREEYHLTPMDGNIQSQTVLLNGKALYVDSSGRIPALEPITVNASEPIRITPYSIVFIHMPSVVVPACWVA